MNAVSEGLNMLTDVKRAGFRLKQLREGYKWTQRQVEARLEGLLNAQQVSRIEKGEIEKPAMADLVALGRLYGRTPNDLAELYGYWKPAGSFDEPAIRRAAELLDKLPAKNRRDFATSIDAMRVWAEAQARTNGELKENSR